MESNDCLVCKSPHVIKKAYPGGSQRASLAFKDLVECQNCNFAWATPRPTQDELNRFYSDGEYWGLTEPSRIILHHNSVQAECRVRKILPYIKGHEVSCLDIGAGQGFIGFWLKTLLPNNKVAYHFNEPDPAAKVNIIENQPDKTACFSDFPSQVESEKFDLIFACHVLEHVSSPHEFITNVMEQLKPEGIAYIEIPHRDDQYKDSVFPHTLFFSQQALLKFSEQMSVQTLSLKRFGKPITVQSTMSLKTKVISKAYHLAVKTRLNRLKKTLNHTLFGYKERTDGIWLEWVFQKISTQKH